MNEFEIMIQYVPFVIVIALLCLVFLLAREINLESDAMYRFSYSMMQLFFIFIIVKILELEYEKEYGAVTNQLYVLIPYLVFVFILALYDRRILKKDDSSSS